MSVVGEGPLGKWSPDQIAMYARLRGNGVGRIRAGKMVFEAFPDAHKYSRFAFVHWERSELGQEMLAKVEAGAADDNLKRSLARKSNRVAVRVQMALDLLDLYDEAREKKETAEVIKLSAEIRMQLEGIRSETDQLSSTEGVLLAPIYALHQRLNEMDQNSRKGLGNHDWLSDKAKELDA